MCSPFREDNNPCCYFDYYNGRLYFYDWGNYSIINGIKMFAIDCFSAVKLYYGLDRFPQVLQFTYKMLKSKYKPQETKTNKTFKETNKETTPIFIETRDWNNYDKEYWLQYGISKQNLIDDKVCPLNRFCINTTIIDAPCHCYAYTDFVDFKKKIYMPFRDKRFITNCSKNDIGGIRFLTEDKKLIITKSYKDYRVIKNLGYNVIWFQNEGMIPNNLDFLLPFKVFIFYDNDRAGICGATTVKNHCKSLGIDATMFYLDVGLPKDASDVYKEKGENFIKQFLYDNTRK